VTACPRIVALSASIVAVALAAPAQAATKGADRTNFAKHCQTQSKKRVAPGRDTPFGTCITAMSRLARAQSRSAQTACATLSRKRAAAARRSPFERCVASGRALIKHGNGVDRSYLEEMIPHHVSAVEMAQLALASGQDTYVRTLAQSIITSQNAEIARMRSMLTKLQSARVPPVSLGLTKGQMGMDHDMSHLVGSDPFDIHFVDMMMPHHQGAITMSRVLFVKGIGAAPRQLAEQITVAQTREIEEMRRFRASVTGSPDAAAGDGGAGHVNDGHPH
jgi:uncharacterized protein (DUF305 family)